MSASIEDTTTKFALLPHRSNADEILVIEDDVALLRLIAASLSRHGFRMFGVGSGKEALGWLNGHTPQLMVLDYNLPDMQGEELLDRIEAAGRRVPFVVATAHGSELVAVEMMKRGAHDYLTKGASFIRLLPAVLEQSLARIRQAERLAETEERLRQAHQELERRVRQRTTELAEANRRLHAEMNERRRIEERSLQHQAELAHVARLSVMGEMVAELAHELNQPLTAISSYAQACQRLLQMGPADHAESLAASLKQVGEQADRAAGIIRRLKRFVTKTKPAQVALDVNGLVCNVADLMAFEANQTRAKVRFDLAPSLPPALGDRIQIEQVLVNLMRNAFESMRDSVQGDRLLTLRTERHDDQQVAISVSDTGVGITEDLRGRLFERFFTTKADGMGMGLSISLSIIESHDGRLWAERNADRGATFHFTLPIDFGDPQRGQ
jgi:C4-dicarboxylate-specific signal transduction histidine kinase